LVPLLTRRGAELYSRHAQTVARASDLHGCACSGATGHDRLPEFGQARSANAFKPANEVYGELLLKAGRPKEALEQFRASLLRTPNRAASLAGAARAARDAGDLPAAEEYEATLRSQTASAARTSL
jgi:Tfp pilus assembly protein PilF